MRRPATTARAAAHSAGTSARTGAPSSTACSTMPRARMAASSSRQWYTSLHRVCTWMAKGVQHSLNSLQTLLFQ